MRFFFETKEEKGILNYSRGYWEFFYFMAKNKSSETPHYELLYIISNKFAENEVTPIVEKIEKLITDSAGEITLKENWGKKHLAYPIKGFSYGYYNLVEFNLEGEKLNKINKIITLSNEIIRHQIVKKTVLTPEEIAKEKEMVKKISAKKKEETKAPKAELKSKLKDRDKDKDKVNLEELDQKLDKILETENLL